MLKTETITINGKTFTRTWSDAGYQVERDGLRYDEAIDPVGLGRTYTETDQPIGGMDAEATEADYLAALDKLGVSE
jgi:hypothetical protein